MSGPTIDHDVLLRATAMYHAYAAAVDAHDLDALRSLVTEDVVTTRVGEVRHGVEAFLDVFRQHGATGSDPVFHQVTNVRAVRGDDGVVTTSAYFCATTLGVDETRQAYGHYSDEHVVRDGRYLIAHKHMIVRGIVRLPAAVRPG